MATALIMPKLGLSMKTGNVAKWLVKEGDTVKKGAEVLEVMTEKITNKVEATADGILLKIVAPKGSNIPVSGLLAVIGEQGEDISEILKSAGSAAAEASPAKGGAGTPTASRGRTAVSGDVKISPIARKLAEENGIDVGLLEGTGPGGRITKEDVEKAIEEGVPCGSSDQRPALEVLPYEGMRRAIGDNMANSWAVAPKVTHQVSVDVSALIALRRTLNADRSDKEKISFTDLLVKAVAKALKVKPKINVTLDGDQIRVLEDINVGVAVALTDGLIVPVVKNADQKPLDEVSKEIKAFAKQARKNKIEPDKMVGGSFTVTNVGLYGSVDYFTPIINQPESAILGIGRTVEKPVVVDGQIVIRPMMGLSLAFDHRVIDGAPAAEFLAVLLDLIQKPHKIFI